MIQIKKEPPILLFYLPKLPHLKISIPDTEVASKHYQCRTCDVPSYLSGYNPESEGTTQQSHKRIRQQSPSHVSSHKREETLR